MQSLFLVNIYIVLWSKAHFSFFSKIVLSFRIVFSKFIILRQPINYYMKPLELEISDYVDLYLRLETYTIQHAWNIMIRICVTRYFICHNLVKILEIKNALIDCYMKSNTIWFIYSISYNLFLFYHIYQTALKHTFNSF